MEENKVAQITDQELRTRAEVLALRDYAHYGAHVDAIFRELVAVRDQQAQEIADRDGLMDLTEGKHESFGAIKGRLQQKRKGSQ